MESLYNPGVHGHQIIAQTWRDFKPRRPFKVLIIVGSSQVASARHAFVGCFLVNEVN